MELIKLKQDEYMDLFKDPYHAFNKLEFNSLNALNKGIRLDCLGFKTKKYKLGIIAGVMDGKLMSPFSAPFGGFSFMNEDVSLNSIEEAVDLLKEYCRSESIAEIELTIPPSFYSSNYINKLTNVLYRKQFAITKCDLNYSIHLKGDIKDYVNRLQYNAKKNLAIALEKDLTFSKCDSEADKELAYFIIKKNRESKGYPLRMTFDAVQNTTKIIKAEFFLVKLERVFIAAAMVFQISKDIVQVIYWGDLPDYCMNKTMNFLSYKVVNYYLEQGIKVIDIGPSTENSIPNYGLGDFKESIGCEVHTKLSWKYLIKHEA